MYNNLKTYINLKGMIGMLVIGHHVWGHAYEHDRIIVYLFRSAMIKGSQNNSIKVKNLLFHKIYHK